MRSRRGLDAVAEGAERDNISLSKPRSVSCTLRGFSVAELRAADSRPYSQTLPKGSIPIPYLLSVGAIINRPRPLTGPGACLYAPGFSYGGAAGS